MNRDESIIAQSSAHDAATLVAATLHGRAVTDEQWPEVMARFEATRDAIMARTLEIGGSGGGGTQRQDKPPAASGDVADPGSVIVHLKKHKGKTIAEIHAVEPEYLTWCLENHPDAFLKRSIRAYLGLDAA